MDGVVSWIQKPLFPWVGSEEFGDPEFEDDCHLYLQRSMHTGFTKRIDIQRIGVPPEKRRQGIASNMLDIIEKTDSYFSLFSWLWLPSSSKPASPDAKFAHFSKGQKAHLNRLFLKYGGTTMTTTDMMTKTKGALK